jgi:hypothetical protein
MFEAPSSGEDNLSTTFTLPTYRRDRITHILIGDYAAIVEAIHRMEILKYCERIAWTDPIPTGRDGEYISVMSRRKALPEA